MGEARKHWEKVYTSKKPSEVSWYQPHLDISLELIARSGTTQNDHIIDVGGGASTLIDDLLNRGFRNLSVLDISPRAIDVTRRRLGNRCVLVEWIEESVLRAPLHKGAYRLWHDRAVFHFLTEPEDRQKYIQQLRHALSPGGAAVISTFSPEGPLRCSGLDVCRYSAQTLREELGTGFRLVESRPENHLTPSGTTQAFLYCLFRYEKENPPPHSVGVR